MNINPHNPPDSELIGDSKVKGAAPKFRLCVTGVGLGLLAVVLTAPIWAIFAPVFLPPLLATVFSVVVPVAAFSVVLWKICSNQGK